MKRKLYEEAKYRLENSGYIEIGMDHFAKETDEMAIAFKAKKLHRNFMGYTTKSTSLLIGLGASAISDSWFGFAQNEKSIEKYQEIVNDGIIPIYRGHLLDEKDLLVRRYIHDLMCHFETVFSEDDNFAVMHQEIIEDLKEMVEDGLVEIKGKTVLVTAKGIPFVRNCCMVFDQNLPKDHSGERLFSKTI